MFTVSQIDWVAFAEKFPDAAAWLRAASIREDACRFLRKRKAGQLDNRKDAGVRWERRRLAELLRLHRWRSRTGWATDADRQIARGMVA